MSKEYNGWTNYETWLVKLWMDNDEGSERRWSNEAEQTFKRCNPRYGNTQSQQARNDLADSIKDAHEAHYLEVLRHAKQECSWISDMIGAAMSEVNWGEIAESLLSANCEDYGKVEKEIA